LLAHLWSMDSTNPRDYPREDLVDITDLVKKTAASLTLSNPILCDENTFSLHDSMAALELMDQKMDCCELSAALIHPKNDPDIIIPPRQIPTGLKDQIYSLPWAELTIVDAANIGLEILTRFESLLGGSSVAESTYTCLYAHNAVLSDMKRIMDGDASLVEKFGAMWTSNPPANLSDEKVTTPQLLVYAQVLGIVEISEVIRSIILHADIYEEEDFSVNTFGLQFFSDVDGPGTIRMLQYALKCIKEENTKENEDAHILENIISFQINFLQICASLAKLTAAPAQELIREAKRLIASCVSNLENLQVILKQRNPSQNVSSKEDSIATYSTLSKCFDPYVYRPLVGNSPVRKVVFRKQIESIPILLKILCEVDWVVCDLLLEGSTLGRIRRMLNRISVSSVNILSRSLIVLNLYFDDKLLGQHPLSELVGNDLVQLTAIPKLLLESNYGKAFLNRLAKPMYDSLKLLVLNRNRQRNYMEAVIFHDWSSLQQEAHIVDANHRQELNAGEVFPPYFTQYALYFTVWLMDHYVALGIELGLYSGHHDLSTAFWYRDFLLASLLNTVQLIKNSKRVSKEFIYNPQLRGIFGKQNGNKEVENETITDDELQEDIDAMIIGLKRSLCRGIVRFITALNQAEMVKKRTFEFTSFEKRFQKQFEPFLALAQPPPLSYDDFREGSDFSNVSQADLLSSTSDCFKKCKEMVDNISNQMNTIDKRYSTLNKEELLGLTKTCVGNSVFLMKLTQQVCGNGKAKGEVEFDFKNNNQFCTIKMN